MPTPRDTAAPDLAQLARDCEARAAAGENPVLEWPAVDESVRRCFPYDATMAGMCINEFLSLGASRWHVRKDGWEPSDAEGWWTQHNHLSCLTAAQLFAESLLRAATLPLHPQAPEVAAAVAFAKWVAEKWEAANKINSDEPFIKGELAIQNALEEFGIVKRDDEYHGEWYSLTAIGRALLASATPDSAPKPDAQPIDREEEKAP